MARRGKAAASKKSGGKSSLKDKATSAAKSLFKGKGKGKGKGRSKSVAYWANRVIKEKLKKKFFKIKYGGI